MGDNSYRYAGSYGSVNDNWMYMGFDEWSISRMSNQVKFAFYGNSVGFLRGLFLNNSYIAISPIFYLNANVTYASGTGEKNSSIRVN